MTARDEQDLALRIGRLEGAVASGFDAVNRRLDGLEATMLRLHGSQTEKREALADVVHAQGKQIDSLQRYRAQLVGWASGIGGTVGATVAGIGLWLGWGGGQR